MMAIVLRAFGSPEMLVMETVPDPVPGPGEVLIRVGAVSVNRSFDLAVRSGSYARGATLPQALACLAQCGRLVTAGAHGGGTVSLDVKRLYIRRLRIIGTAGTTIADVAGALAAAALGLLRARFDRVMRLEDAADAHRLAEADASIGKIILTPDGSAI